MSGLDSSRLEEVEELFFRLPEASIGLRSKIRCTHLDTGDGKKNHYALSGKSGEEIEKFDEDVRASKEHFDQEWW